MTPARLRLLQLRDQVDAVGETMAVERTRFERLKSPDRAPRIVTAHQLFQTPPAIARQMVALAARMNGGTLAGTRILEPSAGLGRIYTAIREEWADCSIELVELAAPCAGELYRLTATDDRARLTQADFLTVDSARIGGPVDVTIMNPPFTRGTDLRHIAHAAQLTRPGGIVVSLCYAGRKQREALEHAPGVCWQLLPPGSFKDSGTRADVALVSFRTPLE